MILTITALRDRYLQKIDRYIFLCRNISQDNERYNKYNSGSRFAGYFQSKNGNNYNGNSNNSYQRSGENSSDFNNGFTIGQFARQQGDFRTNNGK